MLIVNDDRRTNTHTPLCRRYGTVVTVEEKRMRETERTRTTRRQQGRTEFRRV